MKLKLILENLLNEVSVETLKSHFVDTGKISLEDFEESAKVTKNKSAYLTWLLKRLDNKDIKSEDIYKFEKYFDIFNRRKREYPHQDINKYKTASDISTFIKQSLEIQNKESKSPSDQKGVAKANKFKEYEIGVVDGYTVYKIPKGRKDLYGMSCELGSGTEWCTASGKHRKNFDEYIETDNLYIFVKGADKYQFHYESGQFMDKDDQSVI